MRGGFPRDGNLKSLENFKGLREAADLFGYTEGLVLKLLCFCCKDT